MSETDFIKGPWQRVDTPDYAEIHPMVNGCPIALVARPGDADLIAAAPELFEALENIVTRLCATEENDGSKPIWRAAFDALAKARGEVA